MSQTEQSRTEMSRTEKYRTQKSRTEKSQIRRQEKCFRSRRNSTIGSHFIMQEDIISFHAQTILITKATSIVIVILVKLHNFTFIQKEKNVYIIIKILVGMCQFTKISIARLNLSFMLLNSNSVKVLSLDSVLFRQIK